MRGTVIVASRKILPTVETISVLASFLAETSGWVGVRKSRSGIAASALEEATLKLCPRLGRSCAGFGPEGYGKAGVFRRDYDLVGSADRVIAFFSDTLIDGGTAHVVHAAIQKGIAVEAWALTDSGTLQPIASHDATRGWMRAGEDE